MASLFALRDRASARSNSDDADDDEDGANFLERGHASSARAAVRHYWLAGICASQVRVGAAAVACAHRRDSTERTVVYKSAP